VQAYSTLAKVKPAESFLFFDRDKQTGKLAAYADDQGPELPGLDEKIKPFPAAVNGG